MMPFEPKFTVTKAKHISAEFKNIRTPEDFAALYQWLKAQKWRGALETNFAGNGGVNSVIFREHPIRERLAETELPY
jgi:hypothetical protein